ncbi:MAG TPA: DUF3105 domain-containing protein [Gaiellaceae bacterium]|nr:DUF3105 domain-containing protein [Gaiellaceae bacterium]
MAKKKPQTPLPPRGVQAPQRRNDARLDLGMRHRAALYAVSGSGIVALVAVVLFISLGGGGSSNLKQVASLMTAANCSFKTVQASVPGGQTHVNSLTQKLPWNTSPPSNGQHYPEWAVWGFYTAAVNPRMVVHNEEHGGVILWWGPNVPQSSVTALRQLYDSSPTGMVGTPYPSLGSKVAITAWTGNPATYQRNGDFGQGHIAICPRYDSATQKAFVAFRNAYRGHGPEGIPLSADQPGMGPTSG